MIAEFEKEKTRTPLWKCFKLWYNVATNKSSGDRLFTMGNVLNKWNNLNRSQMSGNVTNATVKPVKYWKDRRQPTQNDRSTMITTIITTITNDIISFFIFITTTSPPSSRKSTKSAKHNANSCNRPHSSTTQSGQFTNL